MTVFDRQSKSKDQPEDSKMEVLEGWLLGGACAAIKS